MPAPVPLPQNSPQTASVRSTKISDNVVDLFVGDFRGDPVHSRLSIQCLAQRRRHQVILAPRSEDRQSPRIKVIDGALEPADVSKVHLPAVAKIRRCLQWPVSSGVVGSRDFDRVLRPAEYLQIVARPIGAMRKDETSTVGSSNPNLTNRLAAE